MPARSVPPLPTFAYQSTVTSGQLTQLVTYLQWWSNRPMFRMFQSAAQNLTTNTWTQITMDAGTGASAWDTESGRAATSPWSYVIPGGLTGRWSFRWKVSFASNASGNRYSALYQNGTAAQGAQFNVTPTATVTDMPTGSITVLCSAGDTMAIYGYQSSGATLATDAANGGQSSFFEGSFESFANP